MEDQQTNEKSKERFLEESPIKVFWPSKTEASNRLVKLTEESSELFITVAIGKERFSSDVLFNVEQNEGDEAISFNVKDLIGPGEYSGPFKLIGNIFFVDKEDKKIVLSNENFVTVENKILYMPKDIYFTLDLDSGHCVFKNASQESDMYVKYLAFFLITQDDFEKLEDMGKVKPLSGDERKDLNIKAIDGYENLNENQKEEVKKILDKIIYENEKARVDEFKTDFNKEGEDAPKKLHVPLNEDGSVDIDTFIQQVCPHYAEEEIDFNAIEYEKANPNIPFISEKDITNLGYMGFGPKELKNIIDTMRGYLIDANEFIDSFQEQLDGIETQYQNSLSTLKALIRDNKYDSTKYDQTFKNNYDILANYVEISNQLASKQEILKSTQNTLASFQFISRKYVKNALEGGEFTNKHTFASINVFFKAMKDSDIISENNIEATYTVYNAFLKYVNRKFKELNSYNYFNEMLVNTYDPSKGNTVYSVSHDLFTRTIRYNDLKGLKTDEALERILDRVKDRINYIYDISYYPVSISSRVCPEVVEILAFSVNEELKAEYTQKHNDYINDLREKKWPIDDTSGIEDKKAAIIKAAQEMRDKLNNPEIVDAISGFFKVMWLTVLSEYMVKLQSKSHTKTISQYFKSFVISYLLARILVPTKVIAQKKEVYLDGNDKEVEKELDFEELKVYIGKFLIELSSYIIFTGTSLRLSNLISDKSSLFEIHNDHDAQTFFSVILNGLILSIEVLDKAHDRGGEANNEELDNILDPSVNKLLGKEASKLFYIGLKGGSEEKSRLLLGRQDVIGESIEFTENVFGLVNKFIDELTPA
jgi:hypothetical protein